MTTPTDTPKSDAWTTYNGVTGVEYVYANIARSIERELRASKAEVKELKESAERIGTNRYQQLWKAEAEVERLKGQLTHFDDVHCNCFPLLKAEVERLRDALQS
jgi:hypothetical protein